MSNNLKLKLLLNTLDNVSGPLKTIIKGSRKTSKQLRAQQGAMRALQRQQSDISSFQRMRTATRNLKVEFDSANERTQALKNQINRAGVPTKALIRDFKKAEKVSSKLNDKHQANARSLRNLKSGLKSAGINTRNLTGEQKRLTSEVDSANSAIDKQKRRLSALAKLQTHSNNITAAGGKVINKTGNLAKKGIVAAGLGGIFFKTQLLDTASEFENYEAVLRVVEGTSDKARKALNWSSTFAAKTPFQLNAITEAYVKLRTYGLNPTSGLLQTLGDTSAAMNKPLLQSVEAIADAITGENERLKDFGIKAKKAGENITYEYTGKNGKQKEVTINGNDRKAIENTLKAIWNEKFKGAMLERSKTWSGMLNNMGDQWTRFSNMIMSGGLFDWMKTKLGGLLDKINAMAEDGTLKTLAADWGQKITVFATGVWDLGNAVVSATSQLADMVGGGENLLLLLAGISLAPLATALLALGTALAAIFAGIKMAAVVAAFTALKAGAVAIAVALGPVGLAIAGIVTGITLIATNWDKISSWGSDFLGGDSDDNAAKPKPNNQGMFGNVTQSTKPLTASKPPITRTTHQPSADTTVIEKINIHASPGMDETLLTDKVIQAIKAHERQKQTRKRSLMTDTD